MSLIMWWCVHNHKGHEGHKGTKSSKGVVRVAHERSAVEEMPCQVRILTKKHLTSYPFVTFVSFVVKVF